MGHLLGIQEYLDKSYNFSIFDKALASEKPWEIHSHNHRIVKAMVKENLRYDISIDVDGAGKDELLPKVNIKLIYPEELSMSINPLLKTDKKVRGLALEPILAPHERHHIKNKSLFPLIKEKRVLLFTLLEGEVVRGVISDFSRYEVTVNLKGGIPITILRHSIYDLQDKKGRCFLKSFQKTSRDWEKSPLFVSSAP